MKNKMIYMKNKLFFATVTLFLFFRGLTFAQENIGELTLSLKEAQEYAIKNNKMMISARMDVEASKVAVWETISTALPQCQRQDHLLITLN